MGTEKRKLKPLTLRGVLIAAGIALMAAAVALGIRYNAKDGVERVRFVIATDNSEERVALYEDRGVYYALLPSYADLATAKITCDSGSELLLDGAVYRTKASCAGLEPEHEYSMQLKNSLGVTTTDSKLIIKRSGNIPALSIRLNDGTISDVNADQSISKSGSFSIVNEDGSTDHRGSFKELHGRGNTTWTQPKKSYTLILREDVSLLGMDKSKKWVLLSNCFDESSLRNKLAYDFAVDTGVEYAVGSEYVDLYIDDVYCGLYMLCEKIEVGANSVDITDLEQLTAAVNPYAVAGYPTYEAPVHGKAVRGYEMTANPDDITGGYLLQAEHHEEKVAVRESFFSTDEITFTLNAPKYASKEQIRYISETVNAVEDAIKHGDLSGIDVGSFVHYYIVQELFANNDNCSVFFYKDSDAKDPKIHACSIWDLDLSVGNSWLACGVSPTALYRNADNWFDILYENEQFRALLRTYYTELRTNAQELIFDRLQEYQALIEASFTMDRIRWRDVKSDNDWAQRSQMHFDTLTEHAEYIRSFLQERLDFLDKAWTEGIDYCTVSFSSYEHGSFKEVYGVEKGDVLSAEPDPASDVNAEYTFVGWYDEQGEPYTPGAVITESRNYSARWQLKNSGAFAKLKNTVTGVLDQIDYSFGLVAAAIIGVFALVMLIVILLVIRQDRTGSKRKRGK